MRVPERSASILQAQKKLENEKSNQKKTEELLRSKHQTSKSGGTYYSVCLAPSTVRVQIKLKDQNTKNKDQAAQNKV